MVADDNMFDENDDELPEEQDADRRKFVERLLPELIKRVVEGSLGRLVEQPDNLRHYVQEMRLPKEIVNYIFSQIDETKNGLYRVVAKELRDFLQNTNLADEMTNALTKLSFEVRTEVRFIPNDVNGVQVPKPDVKAEVTVKKKAKKAPTRKSRARKRSS